MKTRLKPNFVLSGILGTAMSAGMAFGDPMPQDNWSYYGKKLSVADATIKKCIAASHHAIYLGATVAGYTTSIQKYSTSGAYLSTFPTTFTDVGGMVCDSTGNLYVFDFRAGSLKAFDPTGNLLWSKGSPGTAQEQFAITGPTNQHALLAVDQDDVLYVLDRGNSRVQIFDKLGNFQSMWGTAGTAAGQLDVPMGVLARNGKVFTLDNSATNRIRVQSFTNAGVYVANRYWTKFPPTSVPKFDRFAITPDGLVAFASGNTGPQLLDADLETITTLTLPTVFSGSSTTTNRYGGTFSPDGDLWTISESDVYQLERRYTSTDNPVVRTALPQPGVVKVAQRPASTLLDIDFRVNDPDSATVEVAALAFVDGGDTLAEILRLATLVEGTNVNVGPGQATNVTKRLTWDAAADWTSSFGEVQIEILAKDQRDLLGVHWITVPANGGTSAFQASAIPVDDATMLSVWFWLIAKGDSAISLVNGEVKGVGGAYNGQTLASGATTTSAGRQFIYGRAGVRAITAPELTSLQSGSYGFSSSDTTTVVKP